MRGDLLPWGSRWHRRLVAVLATLLAALSLSMIGWRPGLEAAPIRGTPLQPLPQSSDALARRSVWSRPESYPLDRTPPAGLYNPSAEWLGRLILPTNAETALLPGDWVWIEVEQAPAGQRHLIGSRLRLGWRDSERLQRLVRAVTVDVELGTEAARLARAGNVVPVRLDGRQRVGPLQSLAGARPVDDVTVALEGVSLSGDTLRIDRPPIQITGRWQGFVTVLATAGQHNPADDSNGVAPDSGADPLLRVRHFNPTSGRFDGAEERIRIPRLPPDRYGRTLLDPGGLARSPLNSRGWLIQGAPAADGVFTVQALQPAAWFSLEPQNVVEGTSRALHHIAAVNWSEWQTRRGSLHSTALVPDGTSWPAMRVGDRALLLHVFGGIGGLDGETGPPWTTTGHFAFGEAAVVRDAFSDQPRLAVRYHQIYANNPNGIVAGSQDWSAYAGNLQRGWTGTRPFSDVLVPIDGPVLDALGLQAEILAARYRSGDGAGVALVTPATSCVQDSSQALWIAIRQLRDHTAQGGVAEAGQGRLARLADALDRLLAPFGMVRADWRHNALQSLGEADGGFETSQRLRHVLLSWRSMLPRQAHDGLATEFLRSGLPLWVLRTNQIPGTDVRLAPVAPTALLGHLPVVCTLLGRLASGMFPPLLQDRRWVSLILLAVYGPLALTTGRASGFLDRPWRWQPPRLLLTRAARLLLLPALVEEIVFRVCLIPAPAEGASALETVAWIGLSVGLFVLYHPLAARFWYPPGRPLFTQPFFLWQCGLLGLVCGLAFASTGSLWSAVLIHWLAVVIWLEPLQGRHRLGRG